MYFFYFLKNNFFKQLLIKPNTILDEMHIFNDKLIAFSKKIKEKSH